MGRDLYAILGVDKDASEDSIKKGYRKAAVKWHPDKHSSKSEEERSAAEEKFKEVALAYEVLSDPDKRAVYDRYGEEGLRASSGGGGGMAGPSNDFPGGGTFMRGGCGPGVRVTFTTSGGGFPSMMTGGRADEIFARFFSDGDPFASFGFGDDDFFATRVRRRGGGARAPPGVRCGGRASASSPTDRADVLARDSVVKLVDLNSEALNASVGVVDGFDEAKQRYNVRLTGRENEVVAVRPANVRQIISEVRVEGTSQPTLNGRVAASAVYDAGSARYILEGLSEQPIAVKPENLVLPPGTRVNITGLQSRPELNGRPARIIGSDGVERYTVELVDRGGGVEQLKVKFGSVVPLHVVV